MVKINKTNFVIHLSHKNLINNSKKYHKATNKITNLSNPKTLNKQSSKQKKKSCYLNKISSFDTQGQNKSSLVKG